jgi:hypothetical protein
MYLKYIYFRPSCPALPLGRKFPSLRKLLLMERKIRKYNLEGNLVIWKESRRKFGKSYVFKNLKF